MGNLNIDQIRWDDVCIFGPLEKLMSNIFDPMVEAGP